MWVLPSVLRVWLYSSLIPVVWRSNLGALGGSVYIFFLCIEDPEIQWQLDLLKGSCRMKNKSSKSSWAHKNSHVLFFGSCPLEYVDKAKKRLQEFKYNFDKRWVRLSRTTCVPFSARLWCKVAHHLTSTQLIKLPGMSICIFLFLDNHSKTSNGQGDRGLLHLPQLAWLCYFF